VYVLAQGAYPDGPSTLIKLKLGMRRRRRREIRAFVIYRVFLHR